MPDRRRGEALGWHGSALTSGSAIGAPIAGIAIDHVGWAGGFVLPGLVGLLAAGTGLVVLRRAPAPAPELPATGAWSAADANDPLRASVGT